MTTTTWTKPERFDGPFALIAAGLDNGARADAQYVAERNAWLAED